MMMMNQHERSGKWTKEEEGYAQALMQAFHMGQLMDIEEGTSLRKYLAKKLSCSAKRISKKFEGTNYKGKMLYIKEFESPDESIQKKKEELEMLEKKFLDAAAAVEKEEETRRQNALAAAPTSFSRATSSSSAGSMRGPLNSVRNTSSSSLLEGLAVRREAQALPLPNFARGNSLNFAQENQAIARMLSRQQQNGAAIFGGSSSPRSGLFPAPGTASLAAREADLRVSASLRNPLAAAASLPPSLFERRFYAGVNAAALQPLNTQSLDSLRLQALQESIMNASSPLRTLGSTTGLAESLASSSRSYLQRNRWELNPLEQQQTRNIMSAAPPAASPKRTREEEKQGEQRAAKRGNFSQR